MGAGAKCDPTRVQIRQVPLIVSLLADHSSLRPLTHLLFPTISDIALTQEDPLARSVRRRLRARGVLEGVP